MASTNGSINQSKDKMTPAAARAASKKSMASKPKKRASPPSTKRATHQTLAASNGYGDSAARLISKGKEAFGSAYDWAGEATRNVPRAVKNMHMPEPRAIQSLVQEKPLILGAVGLGIGVVIGAMLPSSRFGAVASNKRPTRTAGKRKR